MSHRKKKPTELLDLNDSLNGLTSSEMLAKINVYVSL